MRAKRWATWCAMAVLLVCAGPARPQAEDSPSVDPKVGDPGDSLDALREGHLVVWVVRPAAGNRPKRSASGGDRDQSGIVFQERTVSTFGQSASDYGTASSNYGVASSSPTISAENAMPSTEQKTNDDGTPAGPSSRIADYHEQTSGSFGQVSSTFGTASSNHGQTAGTYGQTASSYGTAASNHGQTAGSFGTSLSSIAQAGTSAANAPKQDRDPLQERLADDLQSLFPELQVQFTEVYADELKDDLTAVKGSADYPDLLVGPLPAEWWNGLQSRFGLAMLQPASILEDGLPYGKSFTPEFAILLQAPHMETAKAFALWMSEGGNCAGCIQQDPTKRSQDAAAIAIGAIGHLLRGENIGETADPAMAQFPPQLGQGILVTHGTGLIDPSGVRVEVIHTSTRERLAVVALRLVVSSDTAFGLAHPLVVLRRADNGAWRVLHVSLNLPERAQQEERVSLLNTNPPARAERHGGVMGISQASPPDGDSRPPVPELWWDNGGGAGLQVVEWQKTQLDAHLYLVPDLNAKLQTRVAAQFANSQGRYRWRVWSVGAEGEMKISPWRTLNILPK